ncbi:MAG: hypothetical protein ACREAC_06360 [Blastocatellia bacterium]
MPGAIEASSKKRDSNSGGAESFRHQSHLSAVVTEAQDIVNSALAG